MIFRTDDPHADYDRYCAYQEKETEKYPLCEICEEPILDDKCFRISGEFFHRECFEDEFMVETPVED